MVDTETAQFLARLSQMLFEFMVVALLVILVLCLVITRREK